MSLSSAFRKGFGGKVKVDFQIGGVHQAEQALRDAFAIVHRGLGYKILVSQTDFPDYILRDENGREIRAEAKENASSFEGYDPKTCDLLICWKDDWPDCPVPKLVVSRFVQERPRFEGFAGGEPPSIRALLDSHVLLSNFLKGFHYIAVDVRDLLFLDHRVRYLSGGGGDIANIGGAESPSIELVKHDDQYFGLMFSCAFEGWGQDASNVMLSVDFDDRVFEVRANIGEELIEKFSSGRWEDVFEKMREEGYAVKGQLKVEAGPSAGSDIVGSVELLEEIRKGRVSGVGFTKRWGFSEVFSGDPYDVVDGLRSEVEWMLDFMEEEKLYVGAEKA